MKCELNIVLSIVYNTFCTPGSHKMKGDATRVYYGSRKRHARFTFWIPRSAIHVLSSRSVLAPPLRSCFAVHVLASRFLRAIHVCTVAGSVTTRVVRVFPDYARCILPLRCSQFLQAHVSMSSYYGRPAGTKRVCHCMC